MRGEPPAPGRTIPLEIGPTLRVGCPPMGQPERVGVGVRALLHALDAALAEHRRALALAAGRRETARMART